MFFIYAYGLYLSGLNFSTMISKAGGKYMFRTKSNKEIGDYLLKLINSKYNSRKFCIEYLTKRYDQKPDNESIQNMANRICQITKGRKAIQIEDLPIFSEILDVSVEEILSAGTYSTPVPGRKTNYSIAYSNDAKEWDEYVNRNDKPFLNPDEFNKTVIDYALEVGNYSLLKYLMDKKYIWFASDNQKDYVISFGAGTSIERRPSGYNDILDSRLKESDDLRFKMISLAIINKDYDLLKALHAREIPDFYNMTNILHANLFKKKLPVSNNALDMIKIIAKSDSKVIDYFFEEFTIKSNFQSCINTFIFPYADLLLKELIKNNSKNAKLYLRKAIEYNKCVDNKLQKSVKDCYLNAKKHTKPSVFEDLYPDIKAESEKQLKAISWQYYFFYPENGFLSYIDIPYEKRVPSKGFITNTIHVNAKSADKETQKLIDELNSQYINFNSYTKNSEVEK